MGKIEKKDVYQKTESFI